MNVWNSTINSWKLLDCIKKLKYSVYQKHTMLRKSEKQMNVKVLYSGNANNNKKSRSSDIESTWGKIQEKMQIREC